MYNLLMVSLSPAWSGFLKGIVLAAIGAVVLFLADSANLTGVLSPTLAVLVASIFSAIESSMKASSGGTVGLFGAVNIQK